MKRNRGNGEFIITKDQIEYPRIISRDEWLAVRKELLVGTYNYLDLTPLGRKEDWEEPSGRSDSPFLAWVRHHDKYSFNKPEGRCCLKQTGNIQIMRTNG
jgi:predicted dithiol-disulfide oxidoreductase (DUF899 family)